MVKYTYHDNKDMVFPFWQITVLLYIFFPIIYFLFIMLHGPQSDLVLVLLTMAESVQVFPGLQVKIRCSSSSVLLFMYITVLVGVFFGATNLLIFTRVPLNERISTGNKGPEKLIKRVEFPLNCTHQNIISTCVTNYPGTFKPGKSSTATCPEYFRWIQEDLRPWKSTGISKEMMQEAKQYADLRLVIHKGKAYVERYFPCFQTRDEFTLWGILQLLRLYPGKVPDLELMFNCGDMPLVGKKDYNGPNHTLKSPVFQYCGSDDNLAIVFPDWSFWGWPETNIRPWTSLLADIRKGSKRNEWKDRVPFAYWRGNPFVSASRIDLMKCNASDIQEWNARLYIQDWHKEAHRGFENSKLKDQCTHRYKIYVEGRGWSVSEKYILACDSMVLLIEPYFYDFFTRSLVPLQHYWHIRPGNKCRDIKFAVEWGNSNAEKAQAIGKEGSKFIQENLKMKYVYDYMFHLLSEYAKLLKFKPTVPQGTAEICSETFACSETGVRKEFMLESMVKFPSDYPPCKLPAPYEPDELETFLQRKETNLRRIEMSADKHWNSLKVDTQ